uniref:Phorbol-ester/DAG-type domain-containing protein n=1 Tax=Hucho hucho TaxID=62062 RepID=A0A4W5JEB9_9TELE
LSINFGSLKTMPLMFTLVNLPWFSKGKEKEREKDKDRQQNGHHFSTGSCAGPTVCLVCDKPATGKDLLHCSSCTLMVHKGCNDFAPPCLKVSFSLDTSAPTHNHTHKHRDG